jgi:hypothetical protein
MYKRIQFILKFHGHFLCVTKIISKKSMSQLENVENYRTSQNYLFGLMLRTYYKLNSFYRVIFFISAISFLGAKFVFIFDKIKTALKSNSKLTC